MKTKPTRAIIPSNTPFTYIRSLLVIPPIILILGISATAFAQQTGNQQSTQAAMENRTGKALYMKACATCHGADGTGTEQAELGFKTPVPDFTNCNFATREPNADWIAVAHQGGPARGFSKDMPAMGKALTDKELQKIMDYIRSFCEGKGWPRGELNLPRPLNTEKAYPEDEAVVASNIDMEDGTSVMNEIVYETRFGARNQLEVVVPFGYRQLANGDWSGGEIGDMAIGWKRAVYHNLEAGNILSLTGELIIPSGDKGAGVGDGIFVFEPFFSYGQLLPFSMFFHAQGGSGIPFDMADHDAEVFLRGALGKSFTSGQWGRVWSPMVEVLGARDLASGTENEIDISPQMQVTLNTRQHIMLNIGARIPVTETERNIQLQVYILWDWFDGGFTEGW